MVLAGERIENMIKMGKIQNSASTCGMAKKPFVAYGKKQKCEANETVMVRARAPTYCVIYQQVAVVAPIQTQQPYAIPINQRAN